MAKKLNVTNEYAGFSDYWGGNGRRHDDDAGCLFALYSHGTTLADCVDQWVDDFWQGGDCEYHGDGPNPWEDVSPDDVRAAILDSLTEKGRADYDAGEVCEHSLYLEDDRCCEECGAPIGDYHYPECECIADCDVDDDLTVQGDDCGFDDCGESPIWVVLLEIVNDDDDAE